MKFVLTEKLLALVVFPEFREDEPFLLPPSPKVANAATEAETSTAVASFLFKKRLILTVRFICGKYRKKINNLSTPIQILYSLFNDGKKILLRKSRIFIWKGVICYREKI